MKYDAKPQTKEVQILDIGCGTRPQKDANVIMDIDSTLKNHFPQKEFVLHNANNIPYPFLNSDFDYIYLHHILEHLEQLNSLIFKELYRILKIGGKIEIIVPNSLFIYHRALYFIGIVPCDFILPHKKHYNFKMLKTNLRNSGFKIFELRNLWLFNPFKNFTNPHIKIIAKKCG